MEHDDNNMEAGSNAGLNTQSSCPVEHRVLPWLIEHERQKERARERQQRLVTLEARAHEAHAVTCTARTIALLLEAPAPHHYGHTEMREEFTDTRIAGRWHRTRRLVPVQQRAAEISPQRLMELNRACERLEFEASESGAAARAVRAERSDVDQLPAVDWSSRLRYIEQELETLPAQSDAQSALVDRCQREARVIRSLLAEQTKP